MDKRAVGHRQENLWAKDRRIRKKRKDGPKADDSTERVGEAEAHLSKKYLADRHWAHSISKAYVVNMSEGFGHAYG